MMVLVVNCSSGSRLGVWTSVQVAFYANHQNPLLEPSGERHECLCVLYEIIDIDIDADIDIDTNTKIRVYVCIYIYTHIYIYIHTCIPGSLVVWEAVPGARSHSHGWI